MYLIYEVCSEAIGTTFLVLPIKKEEVCALGESPKMDFRKIST